ncbi:ParA family protein [Vibrio breoganii]
MTSTVLVGNKKGGIGKTTTIVNLAYEASQRGKKTLIIDLDQQSNASAYFSGTDFKYDIGDVLIDRKLNIKDAIVPAVINNEPQENLFLINGRGGDDYEELELKVSSMPHREQRMQFALRDIKDEFDYIFIDTPPTVNTLHSNGITAADHIIVPVDYNEMALNGINSYLNTISEIKMCDEDEISFTILPTRIKRSCSVTNEYGKGLLSAIYEEQTANTTIYEKATFNHSERNYVPVRVHKKSCESAMYYKNFFVELNKQLAETTPA